MVLNSTNTTIHIEYRRYEVHLSVRRVTVAASTTLESTYVGDRRILQTRVYKREGNESLFAIRRQ